jgi:hypothetical protein
LCSSKDDALLQVSPPDPFLKVRLCVLW